MSLSVKKPLAKLVHHLVDWFLAVELEVDVFLDVPAANVQLFGKLVDPIVLFAWLLPILPGFGITLGDIKHEVFADHFRRTSL